MVRLGNDDFLGKVRGYFNSSKTTGKLVRLTIKPYDGRNAPKPKETTEDLMCLVRVQYGKRKISTVVARDAWEVFMDGYMTLVRKNTEDFDKRPTVEKLATKLAKKL